MSKTIQRNTGILQFTSVTSMRNFTGGAGLKDDETVFLNSSSNSGMFVWDTGSSASDDGVDVIEITGWVGNGRFLRRKPDSSGYQYNINLTGSETTTQNEVNEREVDVFDFLTTAEKADVIAGTGAYNVSVALQNAINACNYGKRSLRLRAGEYYTGTTSITINGPIRIYGEGMGQAYGDSFGALCTTIRYVGSDAAVKVNTGVNKSTLGFSLENLAISGYATGSAVQTGSYGLRLGADTGTILACQGEVRNVRCEGFTVAGIHSINSQGTAFYNVRSMYNEGDGLIQEGGATSGGGNRSNSYFKCFFNYNEKRGAYLKEGGNTSFFQCHFEHNNWEGWHVERNASSGSYVFNDFYFYQCHLEQNQESPNTGTAWATATDYERGDFVNESSTLYRCIADHTSGTFATDLSGGNWAEVEYCGQFLVDTVLDTGAGGARVFVDGGRIISESTEANGIRLNRIGVVNHGNLWMRHARPSMFTYPQYATEAYDDNHVAVIRHEDNYAPYIGSPTSQRPISGGGALDLWTLPSAATISALSGTSISYEYLNTGTKERFYATNEDVYRTETNAATNTSYGETRVEDGGVRLQEISDPSAPASNYGIVYCKDNGAGKTQLVVRFPTGAVQVLATEP